MIEKNEKEDPPNSLEREGVIKNDLGRRSPWWGGGRKEPATSAHHQCWSQFLEGFIHPVWWHPPDDGRLCTPFAALGGVGFVKQGGGVKGGLGNGTAPAAMVVGAFQMPRVLMWGLSLYCCVSHRCCTAEQRLRTLGNESCSLLQMGHTAKRGCSPAREG